MPEPFGAFFVKSFAAPVRSTLTTPRNGKRVYGSSRHEVVEGFFFDGVDGKARGGAVPEGIELAVDVFTNETEACLTVSHAAISRAQRAENPAVFLGFPPQCFFITYKGYRRFFSHRKGGRRERLPFGFVSS